MDPDAIENTLSHEKEKSEGPKNTIHDDKTDEIVTSIETGVDNAYNTIQNKTLTGFTRIQGLVAERLPELQKQWNDVKLPEIPNVDLNQLRKKMNIEELVKKQNIDNLKLKSEEMLSKAGENTSKVLNDIDSDLEKFENLTIDYAKQIGDQVGSFFKSQLNQLEDSSSESKEYSIPSWSWSSWGKQLTDLVVGDSPEKVIADETKTELIFKLPEGITPGSRAEVEIKELQSKESIYLDAIKSAEFKDYEITVGQKNEIEELLHDTTLHCINIYKKLVKIQDSEADDGAKVISSEDFWKVYFGKREKILEAEKKRKALLEKSSAAKSNEEDEEEEEFDWD